MKKILPFVAIDLETTGLDPSTDTIIEISAIAFDICRENNHFSLENIQERSMLIDPEIPLSEEVTLITHITQQMLDGKPKWRDIQEKVANFLGQESIILGHNVLFDIAMLQSHGIDLKNRKIIDTFELSEIFSQDATSLNLGFLGDFYDIKKRGQEHRALTDTWISVDLFLVFLQKIHALTGLQKALWKYFALNSFSPFSFLEKFFDKETTETELLEIQNFEKLHSISAYKSAQKSQSTKKQKDFSVFSLNNPNDEIELIKQTLSKQSSVQIITPNKKTSEFLYSKLENENISSAVAYEFYQFIAGQEIFEALKTRFGIDRKFDIFLIKILFWLTQTKNGIVNELKYYGNEFQYLEQFRLQENESNIFRKNHEKILQNTPCIIQNFHKNIDNQRFALYKDFPLLEGIIRKSNSHTIIFENLIQTIQSIPSEMNKKLVDALRLIEAMYLNIPKRPTGENPIPPGKYGETYFLTQKEWWGGGCKWLSLGNKELADIFSQWKNDTENSCSPRFQKIQRKKIIDDVNMLIQYEFQEFIDLGVIVTILNNNLTLQFIGQKIDPKNAEIFNNACGYGFDLESHEMQNFLKQEFDFLKIENIATISENSSQKTQFFPLNKNSLGNKTLVVTTSTKHIRELGTKTQSMANTVLMQGISGGKSKMKHYFLENPEKSSILIGLIDSWREENDLLSNVNTLIIAKIPFDPPTDPHFLAKTIGMSNSFDKYSKPIVLARLNSLIGNAISANPNIKIICSDPRINTTEWGKFIKLNLL